MAIRSQLREQQQALAREHVLDAAEAVVAQRGLAATTLRDIAARAEYSVGALYQFFDGKHDLLAAVMRRRVDLLVADLERAVGAAADPLAALHAIVDVELDHFQRYPASWRLFEELFGGGVNLAHRLPEHGADTDDYFRIMTIHERVMRDGAAAGVFAVADGAVLATMLAALLSTYLSEWMQEASEGGVHSRLDDRFSRADLHALVERTFRR
jgi:AcrR family transcriptional regulator